MMRLHVLRCRTENPMLGYTNELAHKAPMHSACAHAASQRIYPQDYCDEFCTRPVAGHRSHTGRPAHLHPGHYEVPQHHAYYDIALKAPKNVLECPFGGRDMGVWGVTKRFEFTTFWGETNKRCARRECGLLRRRSPSECNRKNGVRWISPQLA